MACAQTSSLSSIEGRLLEGEIGLAYWCMLAILHSLFLPFLFFLRFVTLILSLHSFPFFLSAYLCSVMVMVVL